MTPDVSPLGAKWEGSHLHFYLKPTDEVVLELPADYEGHLAHELAGILKQADRYTVSIDLRDVTALSSRQLGSLIALHKVLRPHFQHVPVVGVSPSVRHLMELTRTDQFFDV